MYYNVVDKETSFMWYAILAIVLVVSGLVFFTYKGTSTLWRSIVIGVVSLIGPVIFLLVPQEGLGPEFIPLVFASGGIIFGLLITKFAGEVYNRLARPVKAREFRAGDEILFVGRAAFRDLKGHRAVVVHKGSDSDMGSTRYFYILKIDDGRELEVGESDVKGFAEKVGITNERRTLDEAQRHVQQAKRHASRGKEKTDIRQAVEELRLAISLNPGQANYHAELGLTYLRVPELAAVQRIDVPFKLGELATLALKEFEEAAILSKRYSAWPALAYWHLGDAEKVIRYATGLKEGWEKSLPKENIELILQAIRDYPAQMLDMKQAVKTDLNKTQIRELVTRKIKSQPTEFREHVRDFLEIRSLMEIPDADPEEARKHLKQAVARRDLGEYDNANMELDIARQLAPSIAWWYETLCELTA